MSAPPTSVPFDARPLTEPVDPLALREYARTLRAGGTAGFSTSAVFGAIVVGGFVLVFGSVFLVIVTAIIGSLASRTEGATGFSLLFGLATTVLPVVFIGGAIAAVVIAIVRGTRRRNERWYRLKNFASANRMAYLPGMSSPSLPGMIFGLGSGRASSDVVRGEQPRFVEFANYQYTTGSGKNRTTHRWGYVAIKLDVPLPHIVLDATSNNSLFGSNLPATFDKDQRLGLEGDFDEHFSLYCPAGYERDALYLFTPDIMARFIDNAAALDVEIVDDWLFLYGKREFSSLDPATWAWLFSVVAALLDKFAQWSRWRDDQLGAGVARPPLPAGSTGAEDAAAAASAVPFVGASALLRPPPGVALGGRRLKRGISWPTIIAFAFLVLYWLASQFGLIDLFFGP